MRYREILTEAVVTFYHGSKLIIKQFTLDNLGTGTNLDQEGPGIYLTSSAEDARKYGNYIHEVQVKLIKSRMVPDRRMIKDSFVRALIYRSPDWSTDGYTNWDENPDRALYKATAAVMDAWGPNEYREALEQVWYDYYRDYSQVYLKKMVVAGWDGFVVPRADGVQHLIAWNPEILTIKGVIQL